MELGVLDGYVEFFYEVEGEVAGDAGHVEEFGEYEDEEDDDGGVGAGFGEVVEVLVGDFFD